LVPRPRIRADVVDGKIRKVVVMHRRLLLAAVVALLLTLVTATAGVTAVPVDSSKLRQAVTVKGMQQHLNAFQSFADQSNGTRVDGTVGFEKSVDYVAAKARGAGYNVTVQRFTFDRWEETAPPVFQQLTPTAKTYAEGSDFVTMEYSGSGDVSGTVQATNDIIIPPTATPSSTSGCEAADFAGFAAGNVALIQRGTCTFRQKAENAQAAGAAGVIIFNEGQEGRTDAVDGTLSPPIMSLPVIGASFAVGQELYGLTQTAGGTSVRLATQTRVFSTPSANVLADTPGGRADRTVVVGAHLDSVAAGPGINDNGSGSAATLEVALQLQKLGVQPTNRVRLAWWGAEEFGLLGSEYYVSHLSKAELKTIDSNLNFDMVASPNFVRFVYDGDASDTASLASAGSGVVESMFVKYFDSQGLESAPTAFDGRSDYDAFISVGIPAGGLFTGAEGVKTAAQAAVYGGTAGEPYDPCYHQACDDIDNLSETAFDQMSDAIAHGVLTFAMTTSAVEGTDKGKALGHGEFAGSSLRQ
jgi:Zn-dependent M28 family amino/carboxypeptidase